MATARPGAVIEVALGPCGDALDDLVDVDFRLPGGGRRRVPAFSRAGQWVVRYAAAERGEHSYRGAGLPEAAGVLRIDGEPEPGLYATGGLRGAPGGRHLETGAGVPFLWLADTWWDALTDRVTDAEIAQLAAQRAGQGFSAIQLVAGLYPEMAPFSREGESRSGWAWHPGFTSPNEAWFNDADTRVRLIVDHGLIPCIVGAWGFYLQHMTTDQMVRHWRELIARWGAYPVVWCLAGEVTALDYEQVLAAAARLQNGRPGPGAIVKLAGRAVRQAVSSAGRSRPGGFPDSERIATLLGLRSAVSEQVGRWTQVARAVRALEPYGRPFSVHPQPAWPPYNVIDDPSLFDFWLLQTGHSGYHTLAASVAQLEHACRQRPRKPAIVGEV